MRAARPGAAVSADVDDHAHALAVEMYGSCPRCDAIEVAERTYRDPSQLPTPHPDFDGATYRVVDDRVRLGAQAQRVWDRMLDGEWRTLAELARATGDPEASVSARLRDFRKGQWGAHVVERRHRGDASAGLYEYRLTPAQASLV